jgi:hypothetical protein
LLLARWQFKLEHVSLAFSRLPVHQKRMIIAASFKPVSPSARSWSNAPTLDQLSGRSEYRLSVMAQEA